MQPSASASTAVTTDSLCQNCNTRPADTPTPYEETLFAETRRARASRMRYAYSSRAISRYGTAKLCSACAAAYHRCVVLRAKGRRLANIGFIVMLVSALVFLILSTAAPHSPLSIVVAAIVAVGILIVVTGLGMYASGRIMRRSAARFVGALK